MLHTLRRRVGPHLRALPDAVALRATAARCIITAGSPARLGPKDLEHLQAAYPFRTSYRYDPESVLQRARTRVEELLRLPGTGPGRVLEVGCADGMLSAELHGRGRHVTGVDLLASHLDRRAIGSGAVFARMDAQSLGFADGTFDFAVSYNSFEHFPDPERVLREIARVLRPGGHVFLQFGPLYCSPWGAHAYRTITVPYCQFLFSRATMDAYAAEHGLGMLRDHHVNGWSLEQYERTWQTLSPVLEMVRYDERRDYSHLGIVRRYPGCFRDRAPSFRNFVVTHLSVLFRKRQPAG